MKGEHLQHLEQLDSWTLREIMVSYGQEVWKIDWSSFLKLLATE